jgi:xanthine dehydrogenase YagS FAD-binding subunit
VEVERLHVRADQDPGRDTVLDAGEVLVEVALPPPSAGSRSSYRKVRARRAWDFALAGVALALVVEGDRVADGRVVLSGVASVPWRSLAVEEAIRGRRLDEATLERVRAAVVEGAEPLRDNGYKLPLLQELVATELVALAG